MHAHVSMRWLRDKLYLPSYAGRILVILDCCYAGNVGRTTPDPYLDELRQRINVYFGPPGEASGARIGGLRLALAATGHNVEAAEREGHGLMTGLLLPALSGQIDDVIENQGDVSIQGVHRYLERAMPEDQKPSLSGDSAGRDCILASYPERAAKIGTRRVYTDLEQHPHTYLPFFRDRLFQERPGEFERLESLLFSAEREPQPVRLGLVAVTGMGGIGKTQLAVQLAYRYQERFSDGIFWTPATGTSLLDWQQHFAELALNTEYLPADDNPTSPENERRRAQYMCRYLANHCDVLLILDNVEAPDLVLSALPTLAGREPLCTILYTSRNSEVPFGIQPYAVEQLPESAALRLLLSTTRPDLLKHIEAGGDGAESLSAHLLCRAVGYLPLALVHLRGLLERDQQMQLARLSDLLTHQKRFDILSALFETFRLSWSTVEDERAQVLFRLACYFPEAAPIPLWLLGLATGLGEETAIIDPLGEVYRQLRGVNLLEELSGGLVRLHPLVQAFGKQIAGENGPSEVALRAAAGERLVNAMANLSALEERTKHVGYWRCLEQVDAAGEYLTLLEEEEPSRTLERIERWLDRESYLLAQGEWWPKTISGLFYQQLRNRAAEEQIPIAHSSSPTCWLSLQEPVGAEDRSLLRILAGHSSGVNSVAFSPDGRYALTGSNDRTARIWEVNSGRQVQQLAGHSSGVSRVAFSPEGRFLITCDIHGWVLFWHTQRTESKKPLDLFVATYEVGAVYWADARHVILADTGGPHGLPHFYHLVLEGTW